MEYNSSSDKRRRKQRSKTVCIHEMYDNGQNINGDAENYEMATTRSGYTRPMYSYQSTEKAYPSVRPSKSFTDLVNCGTPKYNDGFAIPRDISFYDDIDDKSVLGPNFMKKKPQGSIIDGINLTLLEDNKFYTFSDYIHVYQSLYRNGDELYRMYLFTHRYVGDDFCIHESELPGTINVNENIKRYKLEPGRDFRESNEFYKSKWGISRYKKIRLFTPTAFKKMLLYSGDKRLVEYYVFLDEATIAYEAYEKSYDMYNRYKKEPIDSSRCSKHECDTKLSAHGSLML